MTQLLTSPAPCRMPVLAILLLAAGCAAPPVVVPPPPATVESAATEPSGMSRPAAPATAYQWTAGLDAAALQLRGRLSGTDAKVSKTTDLRLWVSLPADEAFAPSRSAVRPPANAWLDQVAAVLRELPRAEAQIVSDADAAGAARQARALALDRAASARDWLAARGVAPRRIGVAARSAETPATVDGQRRLDILIGERGRPSP